MEKIESRKTTFSESTTQISKKGERNKKREKKKKEKM